MKLPSLDVPGDRIIRSPAGLFTYLTQYTVPYGHERRYYGKLLQALGFTPDREGNWFRQIGRSSTAFMAHLDTVGRTVERIRQVRVGRVLMTDQTTILGADDRAGLAILLYLAYHSTPGLYCLFVGEESGCIGSGLASMEVNRWLGIDRAISFDRMGKRSIITHQCGRQTASVSFAKALATEFAGYGFRFKPDPTGVYTDSREFAHLIPECTNISVGYSNAHSVNEQQDLAFLDRLGRSCRHVHWESLPADRIIRPVREYPDGWVSPLYDPFEKLEWCVDTGEEIDVNDYLLAEEEDEYYAAQLLMEYEHRWGSRQTPAW